MWQPDGWGFRARLGILVPRRHRLGVRACRDGARWCLYPRHARPAGGDAAGGLMDPTIALEPVRAFADPPLVDDAAELLAAAPLHAIGFAFTSSSYVRGAADDEILRRRLEARTHGIPVAISSVSAVLGLRTLGARRIALVDPPWFSLTALGVNYFTGQDSRSLTPPRRGTQRATGDQPRTALRVDPRARAGRGRRGLHRRQRLARGRYHPGAGGRSAHPRAHRQPGLLWHLRLAGTHAPVTGYGRLFDRELPNGSEQSGSGMIDPGLQNKVVLVTGANNPFGIGAAIAEAFAAQGAAVFITYLRSRPEEFGIDAATAAEATTPGEPFYRARNADAPDAVLGRLREQAVRVGSAEIDLADPEAIPRLFDRVEETLGPVDILINNAAHSVSDGFSSFASSEEDWAGRRRTMVDADSHDRHFAVNSRAVALLMAEYARRHVGRGADWGRIVNISTDAAGCFPARCPTAPAKRRWSPTAVPPPWSSVSTGSRSTWWPRTDPDRVDPADAEQPIVETSRLAHGAARRRGRCGGVPRLRAGAVGHRSAPLRRWWPPGLSLSSTHVSVRLTRG